MSLNNAQLKTDLRELYTATQNGGGTAEENMELFLNAFVAALEAYVKSGQIIYTDGLTAGPYPVIGTFNGEIE